MSAQRFIRCKHCGMPHEAQATSCPITGRELVPEKRRASVPPSAGRSAAPAVPAPAPASYQWAHSIHPLSSDPSAASMEGDGVRHRDASALIGRVIEGKYRIEALIGRGGMGVVYRAENIRIGRHVAIKILLAGHSRGSESERRFLREARIAGSIGHPNICEVIDLGTLDDGAPFQVMELLEGEVLAARIKLEGALPIDDVLAISEQVLSALSAAHGRGIVHRDLKPDNVFLHVRHRDDAESAVHAKLLDFGVSKSLLSDHTLSLTQTGMVVGTPYYLAPEQARGDRGVDHRVDLWAMGVVMYEALTGTLPFRAENYNALIVRILQTRPAPPSTVRPQLPAEIEAIVMRALAFAPSDRFQSADEMLAALRSARGRRGASSERAVFRGLPDAPRSEPGLLVPPAPLESTLSDLRISVVQGPEDPTEISETFVYSEVEAGRKKG